jgi:hypothetical protein
MERPSVDEFLDSFGGRFYGPLSPPIVDVMPSGWGAHDGRPSDLGRERVFTTYGYRGHAVATADIRDTSVTISCRASVLPELRLGVLEPEQVRELDRNADLHVRDVARRGKAPR